MIGRVSVSTNTYKLEKLLEVFMSDDFDKKMDDLVNNYEKGVDKIAPKLENAVDKIGRGANKLYIGCVIIFANLFFMAFCLWGVYAAYNSWNLTKHGETTTGIVTRMEESESNEGGCCVYSPVIEFQVNGQTYSFDGDTASYPPEYEVGEEVRVLYNPADPNNAQINKFSERWLMPIILIPAMIFAALLVNFFMIRSWRRGEDLLSEAMV